MINNEYLQDLSKHMLDAKYSRKTYFISNEELAGEAINWFISLLDQRIRFQCLNAAANDGICDLLWKHEDCRTIHDIIFDLTGNERYRTNSWV